MTTGTTFTSVVQYTEFTENNNLDAGIFYYEAITNTLNFGYGLNVKSVISYDGSSNTYSVPAWFSTLLSSQVGVSFSQAQLSTIYNNGDNNNSQGISALATSLESSVSSKYNLSVQQNAADSATTEFFSYIVLPGLASSSKLGNTFAGLPDSVQLGLEDAYYNGPGTVGKNLITDIVNGNYAAAAVELFTNTPGMVNTNRKLFDSLQILGVNPGIDSNGGVVSLSLGGVGVQGAVTGIGASSLSGNAFVNFGTGGSSSGFSFNPSSGAIVFPNGLSLSSAELGNISFNSGQFSLQIGSDVTGSRFLSILPSGDIQLPTGAIVAPSFGSNSNIQLGVDESTGHPTLVVNNATSPVVNAGAVVDVVTGVTSLLSNGKIVANINNGTTTLNADGGVTSTVPLSTGGLDVTTVSADGNLSGYCSAPSGSTLFSYTFSASSNQYQVNYGSDILSGSSPTYDKYFNFLVVTPISNITDKPLPGLQLGNQVAPGVFVSQDGDLAVAQKSSTGAAVIDIYSSGGSQIIASLSIVSETDSGASLVDGGSGIQYFVNNSGTKSISPADGSGAQLIQSFNGSTNGTADYALSGYQSVDFDSNGNVIVSGTGSLVPVNSSFAEGYVGEFKTLFDLSSDTSYAVVANTVVPIAFTAVQSVGGVSDLMFTGFNTGAAVANGSVVGFVQDVGPQSNLQYVTNWQLGGTQIVSNVNDGRVSLEIDNYAGATQVDNGTFNTGDSGTHIDTIWTLTAGGEEEKDPANQNVGVLAPVSNGISYSYYNFNDATQKPGTDVYTLDNTGQVVTVGSKGATVVSGTAPDFDTSPDYSSGGIEVLADAA